MSGGTGGGIGWSASGQHGSIGGWIARRRATRRNCRLIREATEAELTERGIPIPVKPISWVQAFWIGFTVGLLLGLLIGGVVWELT
jgi:hypothetical protein